MYLLIYIFNHNLLKRGVTTFTSGSGIRTLPPTLDTQHWVEGLDMVQYRLPGRTRVAVFVPVCLTRTRWRWSSRAALERRPHVLEPSPAAPAREAPADVTRVRRKHARLGRTERQAAAHL